ncbi:MAG: hypothetical protein QJR03_06300 [Sphaerobacter sp.]|nr:hypothetical protein [Sphaerobacter sp.]
MARVALLADRLRVEERLLIEAFAARGHEAVLLPPARLALSPAAPSAGDFAAALDRGDATTERAVLAALLASGGTPVVNRAATARLLADRMALLRHLILAGIPVPETRVCFGEEAIFAAIEALGYPVILKTLTVDPAFPVALVEDRDAAEAIVEHRIMLGGERAVLVQQCVAAPSGRSVRLAVVGDRLAGIEQRAHDGWRPGRDASYEPYTGDPAPLTALGERIIERLGTGTYAVEVVEAASGPVVVGVANLVDFRSLAGRGVDVAGMIAEFVLG